MIYTPANCVPGAAVIDVDTGEKIAHVLSVDDVTGEVSVHDGSRWNAVGDPTIRTIRFRSIVEVEDHRYPCTFHCSGRIKEEAMDIELMPLSTMSADYVSVQWLHESKPRIYVKTRPIAAFRDDAATTAHYMGMEQRIPVAEVIEHDAPKTKPALAGLGVIAGDRVGGIGFCDV